MGLFDHPNEPKLDLETLEELLKPKKFYGDEFSIVTASTKSTASVASKASEPPTIIYEDLFQNPISDEEVYIPETIESTPITKYKFLSDKYCLPTLQAVRNVLGMQEDELDLKFYGIEESCLCILFDLLAGPPVCPIKYLDLRNNPFSTSATYSLSQFLLTENNLQVLNLSNCLIGTQALQDMVDAIEYTHLVELNLSNCGILDKGGAILMAKLALNDTIVNLDVSRNKLSMDTLTAMGATLQVNNTIEVLNLRWNNLYPETQGRIFLKGLRKNKSIRELDLSWSGFSSGMSFAISLSNVLRNHRKLKKIWLEYNLFPEEELFELIEKSQRSRNLEEIYFGGCIWTVPNMYEFLKYNFKRVKKISFGEHCYVPREIFDIIQNIKYEYPDVEIIFKDKMFPNPPEEVNWRHLIIDRIRAVGFKPKVEKLKRDMGHFMLTLRELDQEFMKINDFSEALDKFGAALDFELVGQLKETFTTKTKIGRKVLKVIDIKTMSDLYLARHPTEPPVVVEKVKKEKRGKSSKKKK